MSGAMVGALGICDRRRSARRRRSSRRGGVVHRRRDARPVRLPTRSRRIREGSLAHRAQPADRLLGLSRLEGHAGRFTVLRAAESLFAMRGDRDVYTPQVVVNGVRHVLGSDASGIEARSEQSRWPAGHHERAGEAVEDGSTINVSVAAAIPPPHAEVWICAVSKSVPITISRGENSGHQIIYHNVVRNVLKVGDWNGAADTWSVPLENHLARWRRSRWRLCAGRQPRQARPDARCGVHLAAELIPLGFNPRYHLWCGSAPAALEFAGVRRGRDAVPAESHRGSSGKIKGPRRSALSRQLDWKQPGEEEAWTKGKIDPILTTPGGWGLRNPVPKGPGQPSASLLRRGGGDGGNRASL